MRFSERFRRLIPGLAAVALAASLAYVAQSQVTATGATAAAAKFGFTEMPVAYPPGYDKLPMQTVRTVNPAYYKIRSWISSVGAGVAINDLVGHGLDDGMCLVDPRTDDVVVTYAPTAPAADRFTPFVLNAAPLPYDKTMAPMGCTPGDFNGDGRMDLLVTYWGRTPILFMAKGNPMTEPAMPGSASTPATPSSTEPSMPSSSSSSMPAGSSEDMTGASLSMASYVPQELVPEVSTNGKYNGPQWNTNAVAVADFAGKGHPDIIIGNYFPDSGVLDPNGKNSVVMPSSLSNAKNGGGLHVLQWVGATAGPDPTANYAEDRDAVPFEHTTGWTLAIASADLTGDGLPDVYVSDDFGHSFMLHNVSTSATGIQFKAVEGERTPTTPKSFVLGRGSFKGMGIDFGDLLGNGKFDMMASNITTAWGLEESNYVWMNQSSSQAQMKTDLDNGNAPFTQEAENLGMAWTGWCWDVKMGDFLNSGQQEVVQTDGFVQGTINRWPWLQEMAMMNDDLLSNPAMWPNVQPGDDLAGHQKFAFYAPADGGKYVNLTPNLDLGLALPSRGVAMGDTTGTGKLDFAVAYQFGPVLFYANTAKDLGNSLDLNLYRPSIDNDPAMGLEGSGAPAYGATVTIKTADGKTQVSQLDGGSGHSGKRGFEVHFGIGADTAPVSATIQWHDLSGQLHTQTTSLAPGQHSLMLTSSIQEVQS